MAEKANYKVTRIQDMEDVKEMTIDALFHEAFERAGKGNCELIVAVHEAYKKGGSKNNPEFEQAWRAKTENEMRLHALRAELIRRDVDWVDCFPCPAGEEANA